MVQKRSTRIPQQKRSIEKKQRIMDAARRSFNQNGYFSTTTADIAKEANLSVGSIYAYFTDKKDILLSCMEQFSHEIYEHFNEELGRIPEDYDIVELTRKIIQITVHQHKQQSLLYHNEITALQYRDADVANYFIQIQQKMADLFTKSIEAHGYVLTHPHEQIFILFRMLEGLQDQLAFNQRPDLNPDVLVDEAVQLILSTVTRVKKDTRSS
ncbi:TetR/AcrR family transcriptional regulator [Sporolactobacillus shoreicorticis]|uniref:TetR/AcrR family transcriptional regulator n=1 Tax=Sporolactobacillus shoreicorticis TaxID=1923877 RepID=A0ABW5S666_9BACL|nr:TetR/AcrR family transcriptional regulator [Sporolactobacillus shoreicorticis]MCO7127693.1 TetR/AcrR family transcriptional regulator [Sporolactobacillus shoreicorticis]